MTAMEKYLKLVTEYQKALAAEGTMRSTKVERTPAIIAAEAKQALFSVIAENQP